MSPQLAQALGKGAQVVDIRTPKPSPEHLFRVLSQSRPICFRFMLADYSITGFAFLLKGFCLSDNENRKG